MISHLRVATETFLLFLADVKVLTDSWPFVVGVEGTNQVWCAVDMEEVECELQNPSRALLLLVGSLPPLSGKGEE